MEGVAARPVHQADVGETAALPVVVVGQARPQQHVGDLGDRDERVDRVVPLRHARQPDRGGATAVVAHGTVAGGEPASGQPHLTQTAGQGQPRPQRLLAVAGPLKRPAHVHEGAPLRHPSGQGAQLGRGDPAHRLRPFGGTFHPARGAPLVPFPHHVGAQPVGAHRVPVEEPGVGQPLVEQHVDQRQQHGGVGPRARPDPGALQVLGGVVAQRRDGHELHTGLGGGAHGRARGLDGPPSGGDPRVGQAQTAEAHQQFGVLSDPLPGGGPVQQVVGAPGADQPREQHLQRAMAVGGARTRVPADAVEESVELALGVVDPARAAPAVGAAVDRLVAVGGAHTVQLGGEQVQGGGPLHLHVHVVGVAATRIRAGAVLQPATTHGRSGHTGAMVLGRGGVGHHRGRRRVLRVRADPHHTVALDLHLEGAPMGAGRVERRGHVRSPYGPRSRVPRARGTLYAPHGAMMIRAGPIRDRR